MDWWMVTLNSLRVIIAILFLGAASYYDIKTRTVHNKLWIILGLIGISLFEIQIILEFGLEAFPYLLLIIPITILFMSFLVCENVLNFESRKINQSWIFLICLGAFAFVYFTQFNVLELKQNPLIIGPLILFLLYFMFMEVIINYLDNRVYRRIFSQGGTKKNTKAGVQTSSVDMNNHAIYHDQSVDERISWALFLWLLLFHILGVVFYVMVPIILAKIIALVVLVCIPIVLMILFIRYQAEEKLKNTVKETRGAQSKPTSANISKVADDPDELEVPDELIPIIQRLKFLNILMSVGLIIFGFLLIIYYSVFLELPSIILQAFAITIWLLIFYGFYNLGLPRGGADTKALMVLMILFPIYPILQNITLQTPFLTILTELSEVGITYIFPFAFTVFINAALIMLFVIFSLLIYNSSKHNLRFPHALLGYKMNIREIPNKFVWPLERLVEGKRKFIAFPIKDEEIEKELEKFRASGISKIWVTPKIPFIVPITLGIILTVIMGNLLFEIVLALV